MKRYIRHDPKFVATALSVALMRQGLNSITFTLEEFKAMNLESYGIELSGDFENEEDEIPTSVTYRIVSLDEEVPDDLH